MLLLLSFDCPAVAGGRRSRLSAVPRMSSGAPRVRPQAPSVRASAATAARVNLPHHTSVVVEGSGAYTVGEFMTKREQLHVVKPSTSVDEALERLVEHRITGFPVTDDHWNLIGVVSDYDLLALDSISGNGQAEADIFPEVDSTWKKACELGTKYSELAKEKTELALDLEASKNRLERAQIELKTLGDTMKKALEEKDKALVDAQKVAREKTEAAEKKLAAAKKLEEENARLKQEKVDWTQKLEQLTKRKVTLEKFFEDYTRKMFTMLDEFCQDFEKETEVLEPNLEPTKSPIGDAVLMNMFRLEARLRSAQGYISRLKAALGRIDKELWPEDTLQTDLESMMTRLHEIPGRVQAWKKSAAPCGADVALSLVRVHCKEAREDKLKDLRVMNTKKLQFEDFMETFIEAATRIADGIDLDTFIEPASPSGA